MDIELTVKGEVTYMRLQPNDTIIVTVDRPISSGVAAKIKTQVAEIFPDHKVLVSSGGLTLSVANAGEVAA